MSNKTHFKRIALAVVAALGFGVLASGPSSAAILTDSIALSTATASITAGETATTVVTQTFFANASGDSVTVNVSGGDAKSTTLVNGNKVGLYATTDSLNATIIGDGTKDVEVQASTNSQVSAKFNLYVQTDVSLAAGTYTFYVFPTLAGATVGPLRNGSPLLFTVTVAAADIKPSASTSKVLLGTTALTAFNSAFTDSTIVVSAGTAGSYTPVAVLAFSQLRANGSATGLAAESMTVLVSGAGAVARVGDTTPNSVAAINVKFNETVVVYSDGRTGKGTFTVSSASMPTWTSKSITFTGTAASASIAVPRTVLGAYASSNVVRVTPKDSSDNLVVTTVNMYLHSSETRVVKNSSAPCAVAATAADGYFECNITSLVSDSGTAKIKFANFSADSTTPTTGAIVSNEVEVSVTGSPASFRLSLDKSSYRPGEVAKVTITVLDGLGRPVADTAIASMLTSAKVTANEVLSANSNDTITVAAATHGVGKFTFSHTMPTTGQTVVFMATGHSGLPVAARVAVYETVTVLDPAEEAANSALDAATSAADAAIEAGEAATLAQEAADTAAQAAQDAQATAQAAVDAVTTLSGEVTKLVAQLATLQKLINRIARKVGVRVR